MRIVRHGRNVPFVIKIVDIPGVKEKAEAAGLANLELHICACGLSKHKPFCDGSHRINIAKMKERSLLIKKEM